MKINNHEREEALRRGTFFGFVPRRLEIERLPQLSNFPFNVLFSSFGVKDGQRVTGSAVYNPDFSSLRMDGDECSMLYRNEYGGDDWLRIDYNVKKKSWVGEKFVNGESAGTARGSDWQMFFVHFTLLGLKNGEKCKFEAA